MTMKRKEYEKELHLLQVGVCKLQEWVKYKGLRVIISLSSSRAATPRARAARSKRSPKGSVRASFALPHCRPPSDREKSQMYIRRYMTHFPAAGEMVIFDRSWYNRAGVEHVTRFCAEEQHGTFLRIVPFVEQTMIESGIIPVNTGWR